MKTYSLFIFILFSLYGIAQQPVDDATKLLGELTPIRANFDVQSYHLQVEVLPEEQKLIGSNTILFKAVTSIDSIQIDLFDNMEVSRITQGNQELSFERKHHSIFIQLSQQVKKDKLDSIKIDYHGKPTVAKNAPWDGGFVWETDSLGNPFIGVAVEGLGASSWWPNKDHLSDEPDSGVQVDITVPSNLKAISNGRLIGKEDLENNKSVYRWKTFYPVDNYNVTLYVGDYTNYKEYYEEFVPRDQFGVAQRKARALDIDYYVLTYNLQKAKKHFDFTERLLNVYEYAFGPYPFYEDGFAIIEAPFLGMEHQGAIAYGNNYQYGWQGNLVKPYLEFDYLFVHETGHEWWGNNVSMDDRAAMWIQEAFTTYADGWFVFTTYGWAGYIDYIEHYKSLIKNDKPILGTYGINDKGTLDQYYKGALMLQTLSYLVDDNDKWFSILRKAQSQFKTPKTVSHEEFSTFLSTETGIDLTQFLQQYLETTNIPKLVMRTVTEGKDTYLLYKWIDVVEGFDMPVKLNTKQYDHQWIYPSTSWKKIKLPRKINEKYLEVDNSTILIEVDFIN